MIDICHLLEKAKFLEALALENIIVTSENIDLLIQTMLEHKKITSLSIKNIKIESNLDIKITKLIKKRNMKFIKLQLDLTHKSIEKIIERLSKNYSLLNLILTSKNLTSLQNKKINEYLERNNLYYEISQLLNQIISKKNNSPELTDRLFLKVFLMKYKSHFNFYKFLYIKNPLFLYFLLDNEDLFHPWIYIKTEEIKKGTNGLRMAHVMLILNDELFTDKNMRYKAMLLMAGFSYSHVMQSKVNANDKCLLELILKIAINKLKNGIDAKGAPLLKDLTAANCIISYEQILEIVQLTNKSRINKNKEPNFFKSERKIFKDDSFAVDYSFKEIHKLLNSSIIKPFIKYDNENIYFLESLLFKESENYFCTKKYSEIVNEIFSAIDYALKAHEINNIDNVIFENKIHEQLLTNILLAEKKPPLISDKINNNKQVKKCM